jgi:hypothetical protein
VLAQTPQILEAPRKYSRDFTLDMSQRVRLTDDLVKRLGDALDPIL